MAAYQVEQMVRDDPMILQDSAEKRQRLRIWMDQQGYQGVIISRRDHFAWITAGGDSRVLNNIESGVAHLLITPTQMYLLAHTMDAERILLEQVPGQGYEPVSMRWHEGDPRLRALSITTGRVAADTSLPGIPKVDSEISFLHYPLTSLEMDRSRWLGRTVNRILEEVAASVRPGETEVEIAQRMHCAHIQKGIDLDVLIVGSDERIQTFRHPLPTEKALRNYLLLHPAARRWGLHANVTRSIHFGEPPETIQRAYQAAATIEARILAMLPQHPRFDAIFENQKKWYAELGMPGEWENHFQGGLTGYVVADALRCQTDSSVKENSAFDWFITVKGAKVEELALTTETGYEIASASGNWPTRNIRTNQGIIRVPDLWIR